MKQLTTYIIEKANFLVKKHITNNVNPITSHNDIKMGDYYKVESFTDNGDLRYMYLCKMQDKGTRLKQDLLNTYITISKILENSDICDVTLNNACGSVLNKKNKYSTPNADEIKLLNDIYEYAQYKFGENKQLLTIGKADLKTYTFTPNK